MKVIRREEHQVTSIFTFDVPEEDIISTFGSIERFSEIVSHMGDTNDWNHETIGEEPTDEEIDTFSEFMDNYDFDRDDDWWTDRKGSYDTIYELGSD